MRTIRFLCLLTLLAAGAAALSGEDGLVYTTRSGRAIDGWDAVSFFEGTPREGEESWQTAYKGAQWLFSSQENLALFLEDPEKYAPAYGGYCAWAMSQGYLAPGRPRHWDVIDGRLFLNYNGSTRRRFLKDTGGLIGEADGNWPEVSAGLE